MSDPKAVQKFIVIKSLLKEPIKIEVPDTRMTMYEFMVFLTKHPEAKERHWTAAPHRNDTFSCSLAHGRKIINEFDMKNIPLEDLINFNCEGDPVIHSILWTLGGPFSGRNVWGNFRANNIDDPGECAICGDNFTALGYFDAGKFRLKCYHVFHPLCLYNLFVKTPSIHSTCPLCRAPIDIGDIQKIRLAMTSHAK